MAEQQSLFGDLPPPREKRDRLFFALFPDARTAELIVRCARDLRATHGMSAPVQDAGRMHITLQHVNDYDGLPPQVVKSAINAAETLAMAPFDVTFDRVESFRGSPRPLVLRGDDNPALKTFQQALGAAMAKALLPPDKSFTPHVTLLRDVVEIPSQPVAPITWTVREFVLIHSLIGQTRHIPLGRWALH